MRILVVDDDQAVLQALVALASEPEGHEVRSASTGGQAIQAAMAMGGVDLLLTDVVMEPMDGFTLRDQITARFPGVRTIFCSGYDLSDYAEQTAQHQVLAKPVARTEWDAALAREFAPEPEPEPVEASAPEAAPSVASVPTVAAVGQPRVAAVASAPRAVAAPTAVAASGAPTVKAAGPRAVATAVAAAPRAVAVAQPNVGAPRVAVAAAAPAQDGAAETPAVTFDTSLVGQTIGAYQVVSPLGQGRWGSVYLAVQTSINRQVGLEVLDPSYAKDEAARARFLADARAKAHVQHPSILAVYEAGEAGDHIFFTHEYVDGRTLAEIRAAGERLEETVALKILKVVAEGLNYLQSNHIAHSGPQPTAVYLGADGQPRLANIATQSGDEQPPLEQEIQALGRMLLGVLPAIQSLTPGFAALLKRMMQPSAQGLGSWPALVQGVKALEPKVVPLEAAKISAQDRAAIAAVEAARKAQKRSLYYNIAGVVSLVLISAFVIWKLLFASHDHHLDEQIHIPAGSFVFNDGKTAETGEFWIDKYEVSIGQYGKFVEFLAQHPTTDYDDPRQPRSKSAEMHKPKDWATYYGRAQEGKAIHGVPSDLSMPALMVDWWDAYAYAKWKGHELPTEQEWEKAARGTTGFLYPWGNELDAKKVNSGADYVFIDPAAKGKIDGFNYWGPVDRQPDKSPFGVLGMAGNVSEWTGSWSKDQRFPIIKGGNYTITDVRLDKKIDNVPPSTAQENLGFRTVSHTAPK